MLPLKKTSDHLDPFNFLRYDRGHKALRLSEKFMDVKPFNAKTSLKTTLRLSYLKSNFYNRAYLRNRARTTMARRRRVRLTRKATAMTAPKAYIRGAKAKFLSKRAF